MIYYEVPRKIFTRSTLTIILRKWNSTCFHGFEGISRSNKSFYQNSWNAETIFFKKNAAKIRTDSSTEMILCLKTSFVFFISLMKFHCRSWFRSFSSWVLMLLYKNKIPCRIFVGISLFCETIHGLINLSTEQSSTNQFKEAIEASLVVIRYPFTQRRRYTRVILIFFLQNEVPLPLPWSTCHAEDTPHYVWDGPCN